LYELILNGLQYGVIVLDSAAHASI